MLSKIQNFLDESQKTQIVQFVNGLDIRPDITNHHISAVANELKGKSLMFDLSKTEISRYLATFQSSDNIQKFELPTIFLDIMVEISDRLKISKDHVFLQILDQEQGGKIIPHYDTGVDGYINFKCNVSPLCEDYEIFVDGEPFSIREGDLYSFEASLYKHWSCEFQSRRILLSYGFALRYEELGRSELDPRVRLGKRIQKYFQN